MSMSYSYQYHIQVHTTSLFLYLLYPYPDHIHIHIMQAYHSTCAIGVPSNFLSTLLPNSSDTHAEAKDLRSIGGNQVAAP